MTSDSTRGEFVGCVLYRISGGKLSVLLVQPIGKGRKRWQFPEVVVSHGEDLEEAAERVVVEETGIKAENVDYLGYVDYPNRRLHCYFGHAVGRGAPESHYVEVKAARFLPIDEAVEHVDKRHQQLLNSLRTTVALSREIA